MTGIVPVPCWSREELDELAKQHDVEVQEAPHGPTFTMFKKLFIDYEVDGEPHHAFLEGPVDAADGEQPRPYTLVDLPEGWQPGDPFPQHMMQAEEAEQ